MSQARAAEQPVPEQSITAEATFTPRRLTPQLVSRRAGAAATHPAGLPGLAASSGSPAAQRGAEAALGLDDLPEPLRQRVLGSPEPGETDPWQLWLQAKEALAQEVLQVATCSSAERMALLPGHWHWPECS